MNEKILKKVLLLIIILFIIYKLYVPITDRIYESINKHEPNSFNEILEEQNINKTSIEYEVLEGENSYLVTGFIENNCEDPKKEAYYAIRALQAYIGEREPIPKELIPWVNPVIF